MTTPTEAPREALPEPLKVVAWKSPMWRFYPTRFNAVQNGEQLLDALVRLTDAQSALESECQAHAAEVERLRGDAERYRWLRDKSEWEPFDSRWLIEVDIYGTPSSEMDAAIDQAIARGTK